MIPSIEKNSSNFQIINQFPKKTASSSISDTPSVVPSIYDPHPTVRLRDLPPSLRPLVEKLPVLEINLLEAFFVQTHSLLIELSSQLPLLDMDALLAQFSALSGIIRLHNYMDADQNVGQSSVMINARIGIRYFVPYLAGSLISDWNACLKNGSGCMQKMKPAKKLQVEKLIKEITENFNYLRSLSQLGKKGLQVLDTSLLHIENPEKTPSSTNDWLELMINYTKATKLWFDKHQPFWAANERNGDPMGYRERVELIQKLISRRMKQSPQNTKTLMQLHGSLNPHFSGLGSMHVRVLNRYCNLKYQHSFMEASGFDKHTLKKTAAYKVSPEEFSQFLYPLIQKSYSEMMKLDSKRIIIVDSLLRCATADRMQKFKIKLDSNLLEEINQNALDVSHFFTQMEEKICQWKIFSTGTTAFSFADMGLHIKNISSILQELAASSDQYSSAILHTAFDLKSAIGVNLIMGAQSCLQHLNQKYDLLQKNRNSESKNHPKIVGTILDNIKCTIEMIELLDEKSGKLGQLFHELVAGEAKPHKKVPLAAAKKKRKNLPKTKNNKKKPAAKAKLKVEKREKICEKELKKPLDTVESFDCVPTAPHSEEEPIPLEQATQQLKHATDNLIKFLEEAPRDDTFTPERHRLHNVKWRTLCKELHEAGFILKRATGSHHLYHHPEANENATVPINSKDALTPKVAQNVFNQIEKAEKKLHHQSKN